MRSVWMVPGALLCFPAMACLSFAMARHYGQLTGMRDVPAARRRLLRGLGWLLLCLSFAACVQALGASIGAVLWFGCLSLAGLLLAWALPYRPRFVKRAALVCLLASAGALFFLLLFSG